MSARLPLLVGIRFQVLFHSPHRGSFHLSLTVLCAIGHQVVFSLGGWSPQLPTGFLVSRGTQDTASPHEPFRLQAYHLLWRGFPSPLTMPHGYYLCGPTTPGLQAIRVWALPLSLAATEGISFDFSSSGY